MIVSKKMLGHITQLLRDSAYRQTHRTCILEGEKAVYDAIQRGHTCLSVIIREDKYTQNLPPFPNITCLPKQVFEKASLMRHSTGIMGLFQYPKWGLAWQDARTQVALLDGIQSPQNVGAILRNAAAFGIEAVIALPGTADFSHPESMRASSGYALDVPFFRCTREQVTQHAHRFQVYILSAKGVPDQPIIHPCMWVLGNEGQGPSWSPPHAQSHRIAMTDHVESLNVSVASGICFHTGFLNRSTSLTH